MRLRNNHRMQAEPGVKPEILRFPEHLQTGASIVEDAEQTRILIRQGKEYVGTPLSSDELRLIYRPGRFARVPYPTPPNLATVAGSFVVVPACQWINAEDLRQFLRAEGELKDEEIDEFCADLKHFHQSQRAVGKNGTKANRQALFNLYLLFNESNLGEILAIVRLDQLLLDLPGRNYFVRYSVPFLYVPKAHRNCHYPYVILAALGKQCALEIITHIHSLPESYLPFAPEFTTTFQMHNHVMMVYSFKHMFTHCYAKINKEHLVNSPRSKITALEQPGRPLLSNVGVTTAHFTRHTNYAMYYPEVTRLVHYVLNALPYKRDGIAILVKSNGIGRCAMLYIDAISKDQPTLFMHRDSNLITTYILHPAIMKSTVLDLEEPLDFANILMTQLQLGEMCEKDEEGQAFNIQGQLKDYQPGYIVITEITSQVTNTSYNIYLKGSTIVRQDYPLYFLPRHGKFQPAAH